jgi:ADP-ribose pyrophosphatase YjhB (NUDIX family)
VHLKNDRFAFNPNKQQEILHYSSFTGILPSKGDVMAVNQLKLGAFGIWVQDQKILVAHRLVGASNDNPSGDGVVMGFPGNYVSVGQTPVQVLENSFLNQTGAEVGHSKMIFVSEKFHVDRHDASAQVVHLYYLIKDDDDQLPDAMQGDGKDVLRLEWYPMDALPLQAMTQPDQELAGHLKDLI